MSIFNVQMMAKRVNATRHNLSTTAAANFHSLQISSPSSCFLNRIAMNWTSSRIFTITGRVSIRAFFCTSSISSAEGQVIFVPLLPRSFCCGQHGLSMAGSCRCCCHCRTGAQEGRSPPGCSRSAGAWKSSICKRGALCFPQGFSFIKTKHTNSAG